MDLTEQEKKSRENLVDGFALRKHGKVKGFQLETVAVQSTGSEPRFFYRLVWDFCVINTTVRLFPTRLEALEAAIAAAAVESDRLDEEIKEEMEKGLSKATEWWVPRGKRMKCDSCNFPEGTVYWNPYNKVVQCHNCGAVPSRKS